MNFVQLDRRFHDVSSEDDVYGMAAFVREHYYGPTTWKRLLESRVVVVVAEARAGKSEECRQLAHALSEADKIAFFVPLRDLAQHGLPDSLRGTEDADTFAAWLKSDKDALFLLDSVDEWRIAGQTLRAALQNLMQAVRGHENRLRIVITSRLVDWRWEEDERTVRELLAPVIGDLSKDNDPPMFRVVAMRPLNFDQAKRFCEANHIEKLSEFLSAIEQRNAGDFVPRPADLHALISLWKRDGRIGSLQDILEETLRLGLQESNPEYRGNDPLSFADALNYTKHLAAVLTLTKKASLLLPDAPAEIRARDDVLAPREILPGLTASQISRLLDRRLFSEAGMGRIRLYRDIQDFLTAQWLRDILVTDGGKKEAEALLFRSCYGVDIIPPTLDAACAWVGLWDERIRRKILKIEPDNLIRQGDPEQLSKADRRAAIDRFVRKFRKQTDTGVSFDINALKKFPVADFADHIRKLLLQYRDHLDIRHLLLRLIWARKLESCVEDLFAFVEPGGYDLHTRKVAVRAIAEAGTTSQQNVLAGVILDHPKAFDEEILGEVVQSLYPSPLTGEQLTLLLEKRGPPSSQIGHGLKYYLEEVCATIGDATHAIGLLDHLVSLVRQEPYWKDHSRAPQISEKFHWLCPAIGQLVAKLLRMGQQGLEGHTPFLEALDILIVWAHAGGSQYSSFRELDIGAELNKHPKVKRAHFWFQKAKGRNDWDRYNLCTEDIPWLLEDIQVEKTDDEKVAAFRCLLPYSNDPIIIPLSDLQALADRFSVLKPVLDKWLEPLKVDEELEAMKRAQKERQAAKAAENQEWVDFVKAHTAELANVAPGWENHLGQVIRDIAESDHDGWGIDDWRAIEEKFGSAVAEAVRDGCRKYWRTVCPLLASESATDNKSLYGLHFAGLSGVNFEHLESNWPRNLSHEEAEIAARYALIELNAPPTWLDEIHAAFPGVVPPLLLKEIAADWTIPEEQEHCHTLTQSLRYRTLRAAEPVYPYMLDRLESEIPPNRSVRGAVIDHLLNWQSLDETRLAAIAPRELKKATDLDDSVYWMAVWLNVDALRALRVLKGHLRKISEADPLMLNLCNAMNTRERDRIYRRNPSYAELEALTIFLPIVYRHIRREDDREHRGVFTPDARDDAEGFRSQLLEILINHRSKEAYKLILKLSRRPEFRSSRDRFRAIARQKAATDGDLRAWTTSDFMNFERKRASTPTQGWSQPISLRPGAFGFGIDLKSAWRDWIIPVVRWIRRHWRNLRS